LSSKLGIISIAEKEKTEAFAHTNSWHSMIEMMSAGTQETKDLFLQEQRRKSAASGKRGHAQTHKSGVRENPQK
jgi:hypothetical protein